MTLDTKAAHQLRIAAHRQLRAARDDGWGDLSPIAEYIEALEAYNTTRSQSLPDELKAIADRAKIRRAVYRWGELEAYSKEVETDRSILDHTVKSESQIREEERERCAKELDEAAEIDLQAAEQTDGPETKRRLYAVSRRLRGIATAIRTPQRLGWKEP